MQLPRRELLTGGLLAIGASRGAVANCGSVRDPDHVTITQSGQGAVPESVQATLRRLYVLPEQFGGTDTEKVQAAFNSAGDTPGGQNVARIVRLSRFYETTATIDVPSYVAIEGVSPGRCGLRPAMFTGPALRASVDNNTSSYLTEWRDFTIDGVNATEDAYALEMVGQKITTLSRVGFTNFDTGRHALDMQLGIQSVVLDQCRFYKNRLHQRIGKPYVGVSFPTTVTHRACVYEDGLGNGTEAVLIEDASSCTWDHKCVLQGNAQPVVFRVRSSAGQQTSANHQWVNTYIEGNGIGQMEAYTWRLDGDSPDDKLAGCVIIRSDIHGDAPSGGHIYARNTDLLQVKDNRVTPSHTWLVSGGGNTRYDIDARYAGGCEIQSAEYNTTIVAFMDDNSVRYESGILTPRVIKQATGRYHVKFNRAMKGDTSFCTVTANDRSGHALLAAAYFLDNRTVEIFAFSPIHPGAAVSSVSGSADRTSALTAADVHVANLTVQGLLEPL